jgi:hypothetical protein
MLAKYIFTSANLMDEASSQLYIEPPQFSQQFSKMEIQHKKKPGSSYERFNSRDDMRSYFQENKERAKQREKDIEEDYDYGENMDFAGILSDVPCNALFL